MSSTKNKIELMNENYGGNKNESLLKQYEMLVNSSEKVSSKRMNSNNFYLGVNTTLFAVASYLSVLSRLWVVMIISFIGILLSLCWISSLTSYKKLNSAKFKIIHDLEEYLPARIFAKEDEYLNSYYTLTNLEKYIPYLFIILYSILIIIFLPYLVIDLINNIAFGGRI